MKYPGAKRYKTTNNESAHYIISIGVCVICGFIVIAILGAYL